MSAWDWSVLAGAFLAGLISESALLYASTALGNVGLKLGRFLLASSLAALVWAVAVGGVVALVFGARSFAPETWAARAAVAAAALAVSWLVPALLFAWAFST